MVYRCVHDCICQCVLVLVRISLCVYLCVMKWKAYVEDENLKDERGRYKKVDQ